MTIEFKPKYKSDKTVVKGRSTKFLGISVKPETASWVKEYAKENNTFVSSVVEVAIEKLRAELEEAAQ